MDSKEGIAQVAPTDAQAAGLLDPSLLWPGMDEATTADPRQQRAGGLVRSPTSPHENSRRESCCLYIRVLRDSDVFLEQDRKVPDYCWNAGICKDICEAQTRVLPGTFSVNLLSDTEFLVYKLPKTGLGMSEQELALFVDLCREVICELVFQLTYLSHHKLPNRQEGTRPKCVNIAIELQLSD